MFSSDIAKPILNCITEAYRSYIIFNDFDKEKNNIERITLLKVKAYYIATVIGTDR